MIDTEFLLLNYQLLDKTYSLKIVISTWDAILKLPKGFSLYKDKIL